MDYTYKKVLPEDVFVTMLPENGNKCTNRISGVEFMDVFARLVWDYPHARVRFYASQLQVDPEHLNIMVFNLSGIFITEWRDRFVNLAAKELLEHSLMSISDVAERLSFGKCTIFSRYFTKHNKKSPISWRYAARGFNTNQVDIMRYKLRKLEE